MAKVTVKYYGNLRKLTQKMEDIIEANTAGEVIEKLASRYGHSFYDEIHDKDGRIIYFFIINGDHYNQLGGLGAKLKDNDVLSLLLPIDGG